jgi:hypothetical protein
MKLKFFSTPSDTIDVSLIVDGYEKPFDYVEMIRMLYEQNSFEETEYCETIKEQDRSIINKMLEDINKAAKREI